MFHGQGTEEGSWLAGTKMTRFLPLGISTSPQRCTARVQRQQPPSLSNNYLDFLVALTRAPWSLVDLRPQPPILLRSRFGGHASRTACGEFRPVSSAESMFSTSIRRDLGGSRRTATAFQSPMADTLHVNTSAREACNRRPDGKT